jgi:hypothetical protein
MLSHFFLKNGIVYIPTVVQLKTGAYQDVDPVTVVAVTKSKDLHHSVSDAIARKNMVVPPPTKGKWPQPVLLQYAGVKTWSAFARGASLWSIEKTKENYQIIGYRTHPKGYWARDPGQKIDFPPETSIDTVVEQMIAILQDAAKKHTDA